MRKVLTTTAVILMTLFSFACGKDESEEVPAATTTTEQAGAETPADVAPLTAQTWIDDVTIGSELGPDGSMAAGKTGDDFAPGQPIHLAMEVGDAPASSQVKVVWYGPNETKIGEAEKLLGPYLWGRYDLVILPPSFPYGGMETRASHSSLRPRLLARVPTLP